jgi:outer membrane protein OmpA-like peptidoglycan-associated protein
MHFRTGTPALLSVVALTFFTGACATKKHVREQIAPVQQQVSDVQKTTQDHTASIGDLDRNVARVNEAAMEADKKAAAAAQSAERAQQSATQAQSAANNATQLAEQSMARAGDLERRMENLDNFQLVTTEKVYFGLNRSELTKAEKEKLDQAVQSIQNMRNFVIEIAGYTDRTGSRAANLELSRRRANAVVRYLTVQHNIPLRKIHDIGAGSEFPDADNSSRAARKENRRVDIRIYSLDSQGGGQQQQQRSSIDQ